jgi:hypothetical protein
MTPSFVEGNFDLPLSVAEVAAVIGRRNALILAGQQCPPKQARGASRRGRIGCLYVPKQLTPRFVELVGCSDVARALIEAFRGELRWFPPCQALATRHRNDAIRRMRAQGFRATTGAIAFDLTPRAIRQVCEFA